jgi:glucan phosphoethanolaminetransferase (alkaline phosphatase superfamily)
MILCIWQGIKPLASLFFLFSTLTHIKMGFVTITLGSDGCVDNNQNINSKPNQALVNPNVEYSCSVLEILTWQSIG